MRLGGGDAGGAIGGTSAASVPTRPAAAPAGDDGWNESSSGWNESSSSTSKSSEEEPCMYTILCVQTYHSSYVKVIMSVR